MANSPVASPGPRDAGHAVGKTRVWLLVILLAALAACFLFSRMTSDAMAHMPFLGGGSGAAARPSLVDLRAWQTAQAVAAMAVTVEENEYARRAEHLADHAVDQAFAAALRKASLDDQHRQLTGPALALKQKVAQLEQLRSQDQALVDKLTAKAGAAGAKNNRGSDALQVAKAQLGLDNDEIADAQHDLERASGDESARVQDELNAHEQSMQKYDSQVASGQLAVISMSRNHTLAARLQAWLGQRERYAQIAQAEQQALEDVRRISAEHSAIESQEDSGKAASFAGPDNSAELTRLHNHSIESQLLAIDDDRIQTEQQLAAVYAKWADQVQLQHRIVLHLILGSLMVILCILVAMLLCDALVRRLMARPGLDRRQMRTLRNILELLIQLVGISVVLIVIFGPPRQTPTILGFTTAALTIALQDYIVAFLGWFTLVGKNGIHVGDWVEINGVCGEVVEFRLLTTSLLETGGLADEGHPTGRRITFMNSFAIRGNYFNFSTTGQWLWDEITASMPASIDVFALAQRVEQAAAEETREFMQQAEREWRHGRRPHNLQPSSAAPIVLLRPSSSPIDLGSGIELQVRFVTSAADRFEVRKRLYRRIVELLHEFETGNKRELAAPQGDLLI